MVLYVLLGGGGGWSLSTAATVFKKKLRPTVVNISTLEQMLSVFVKQGSHGEAKVAPKIKR